jgi:hypothetical protein
MDSSIEWFWNKLIKYDTSSWSVKQKIFNRAKEMEKKEKAERMYSEDDMIKFAKWSNRKEDKSKADLLKIWLEQFKN